MKPRWAEVPSSSPLKWLRRLILYAGEEPHPHLHLAVQTDTFTWNLCTIRIEIGAEPSYCSGTTQEPSPSLSLLIFNHNILKEIPWNICNLDRSPGGFSLALEPHCKFCLTFCVHSLSIPRIFAKSAASGGKAAGKPAGLAKLGKISLICSLFGWQRSQTF